MVVMTAPSGTSPTFVKHERTGWPFTWTVQDPHNPMPQPNLVPVKFGAGKLQVLADHPEQRRVRLGIGEIALSINTELRHGSVTSILVRKTMRPVSNIRRANPERNACCCRCRLRPVFSLRTCVHPFSPAASAERQLLAGYETVE